MRVCARVCNPSHPTVGVLSPTHALEDSLVEPQFQTGLVEHLPLVAVSGDQTVDLDCLGLTDTMTPSLGLEDNTNRHSTLVYGTFYSFFCSVHREDCIFC